jgi:hypothetical protein
MPAGAATLTDMPPPEAMARLDPAFGRRFLLVVDTEEAFDWAAPFSRAGHAIAIAGMPRAHAYFRAAGVRPVYATDWPMAQDAAAAALIGGWLAEGGADLGAHLHPWVNPPFDEAVSAASSFAGNLPPALERAKLAALVERLESALGQRPRLYRAGRYGIGPATAEALVALGIGIDSSVRSRFDYRADHGPDFRARPVHPWWLGGDRALLELPLSTAFAGRIGAAGERLYHALGGVPRGRGVLAGAGLIERVPLTPEGVDPAAAVAAIDALLAEDVRLFGLSFHSPSVTPGHTPYVRDEADLAAFYRWWDVVLGHFARRGVAPATLDAIIAATAADAAPLPSRAALG